MKIRLADGESTTPTPQWRDRRKGERKAHILTMLREALFTEGAPRTDGPIFDENGDLQEKWHRYFPAAFRDTTNRFSKQRWVDTAYIIYGLHRDFVQAIHRYSYHLTTPTLKEAIEQPQLPDPGTVNIELLVKQAIDTLEAARLPSGELPQSHFLLRSEWRSNLQQIRAQMVEAGHAGTTFADAALVILNEGTPEAVPSLIIRLAEDILLTSNPEQTPTRGSR